MSHIKFMGCAILISACSGCGVNVEQWEINEAVKFCEGKAGVDSVTFYPGLVSNIQCIDGTYSSKLSDRKAKQ